MEAVILSIGDELVLGQTVDTNSAYLSAKLAERGIATRYHQTIEDDRGAIAEAIAHAAQLVPLMIITGGLGPTEDDLTRHALADAMGAELVEDAASLTAIRTMMERFGRKMAERNKVQALHPAGSTMIDNTCGTAPGIKATLGQTTVYVTPGVPREMVEMFALSIEPQLPTAGRVILTAKINTFGNGESNIAEMLGDLCDRDRNPLVGTTVTNGIVSARIRSVFDDADEARRQLNDTMAEVEAALGALAFGREDTTLQEALVKLLIEKNKTVAAAESCTGGLISKMFTDVPGSSAAVTGGWVTYTNGLKIQELGVRERSIVDHGAVSAEVASEMAAAALRRAGADAAVGVTGVAGPDGGTDDKPVGLVHMAAHKNGKTVHKKHHFGKLGREVVRSVTIEAALNLLLEVIAL